MQPLYLELKPERYLKRSKKWRSEELLKAHSVMTEAPEATAWSESLKTLLGYDNLSKSSCFINLIFCVHLRR